MRPKQTRKPRLEQKQNKDKDQNQNLCDIIDCYRINHKHRIVAIFKNIIINDKDQDENRKKDQDQNKGQDPDQEYDQTKART